MSRRSPIRGFHVAPVLGEVGPFLVVGLFAVTAIAQAAALVGWQVLASQPGCIALLVVAALVGAWGAQWRRLSDGGLHASRSAGSLLVCSVPALLLVTVAVVLATKPLPAQVGWFLGGDHVRHLLFVTQERVEGYLAYGSNSYPRAWHTLVAAAWTAEGGTTDLDGLLRLVPLMATLVWLLYAALSLTTALLARALAARVGLDPRLGAVAGLVAGAVTLWPTFLSNYMSLGFENSLLASLLIAVVAREAIERPESPRALLIAGCATALLAHVWQLLLPPVALTFAYLVWNQRRAIRDRPVAFATFTLLCVAVGTPGMVAVVTQIGLDHATDAGVVAALPLGFLPFSFVAVALVVRGRRQDQAVLAYGAAVAVTVIAALGLAAVVGIPPWQYYPAKMLWSAVVLALAAFAVGLVVALRELASRGGVPGQALAVLVPGLLVALCLFNTTIPMRGGWTSITPARVLNALSTPDAAQAQVVWLPADEPIADVMDALISRILLDYFRAEPALTLVQQSDLTMEQSCALLREHGGWVLSDQPEAAVRAHYSCEPSVKVIPLVDRFG